METSCQTDGMSYDPQEPFSRRVEALPRLGVGISTEFGAGEEGLDPLDLRARRPELLEFLEVGADLERGFDDSVGAWARRGWPTTYHFLDANLEGGEGLTEDWCRQTVEAARSIDAAWLCGDAGLWHIGPNDRGHGTLMPPVLVEESAVAMADVVRWMRVQAGIEILPENPPAQVYVGNLHLLDYYRRVAEGADCGLLLDVAHLAIYQSVMGHAPLDGLLDFPLDRIVEVHVAGSRAFEVEGKTFHDDDHGLDVLPATWEILGHIVESAPNLRAIVIECERNRADRVEPVFERVHGLAASAWGKA